MEYKKLIADDVEFLKSLGHEMNTQDDDSQADPRFWVVAENKREYGIDSGYQDGEVICGTDGESFETVNDFIAFLIENDYLSESDIDRDHEYDSDEIFEMLDSSDFYTCGYRDQISVLAPNTMFFTKRECQEHIKRNDYHYTQPHTYAMTA